MTSKFEAKIKVSVKVAVRSKTWMGHCGGRIDAMGVKVSSIVYLLFGRDDAHTSTSKSLQ